MWRLIVLIAATLPLLPASAKPQCINGGIAATAPDADAVGWDPEALASRLQSTE